MEEIKVVLVKHAIISWKKIKCALEGRKKSLNSWLILQIMLVLQTFEDVNVF